MANVSSSNSLGERVPKLRFPEFEGGWDFELFSDLFTFLSNNTLSRAELSETGNIRNIHYGDILVRYTDVINVDDEIIPFVSNASESKVRCGMLRTGDVIIADTAEDATVGKAIEIINYNNKPVVSGLHTMPCRPKRDFIASFLGYYINSNAYHSQLYPYMQGIKVTSISKANIGKTLIHFPSRSEQKKIVELFNLIEKKILIQKKLVDALKLYKRGLLSKLFPQKGESVPQYRFTGFTDAWEQRKLGEVTESYSGGTPSVGNKAYYGGTIPFIRSAEINSYVTELFLTEQGLNNSSAKMVSEGDILYALYGATSGEVGRARLKGAINQAILAILPHDGYDAEFLMQWLRKSKQSIIDVYLQGGQGNLSGAIVKELNVMFPSYCEQKKIGNYFSTFDHLITLHQRKQDFCEKVKLALLQQMFI